jgi:mRNA-degrading endonuclease RelE of RelBE toxin-antitoxin system
VFEASEYWITVVELPGFSRAAGGILTPDEIDGLTLYLANNPDEGDVIPGTGGLRKLRWAAKGKGKRGGARVIYYFRDLNMPLYLLTLYGKGEKIALTAGEKREAQRLVEGIVRAHWESQVEPRVRQYGGPLA